MRSEPKNLTALSMPTAEKPSMFIVEKVAFSLALW